MEPSVARARLLSQHEGLRDRLGTMLALAERFRAGTTPEEEIIAALDALRDAFEEHNRFEESLLEPMLRETDAFGEVRVARMVGEHSEEHRAFMVFLGGPVDDVVRGLADFIEEIAAHMEAEERTFLHPAVLRDDVVAIDHSGA